ncbi:muellerian-inhibiting factor [Cynoglossus semilaevis]|uniref:muellerian-inhibiting factor n=1 Tax=Cynoglossus semilaevis TaxID=244447 RepID=UPI0004952007|nr:muellerian-inhibiting factor [Cynoglossus semilaevis]
MLLVDVLCCGVLTLCWIQLCVAPDVSGGQQLIQDQSPSVTDQKKKQTLAPAPGPDRAPCYVDDIFAALRESVGNSDELTASSFTLFGICRSPGISPGSVLHALSQKASTNQGSGLTVVHPTDVAVEEDDRGTLVLRLDLPPSPLLALTPVLLLVFENLLTGDDVQATFTSHSLQPNTQSACISGETRYILLTGEPSAEGDPRQNWRIGIETTSPDMKPNLKDFFTDEKSRSKINITPLLLVSGGTSPRPSSASSQTFSFLCELKRFLCEVLPQDQPHSPHIQLNSLLSSPPLSLGPSSSEAFLVGLMNSSSPTVFSFTGWSSAFSEHHGQLALSPALLEEVRRRLEHIGMQVVELIKEEAVGERSTERMERLKQLSELPTKEPAPGESQYRAFLLVKALQTVLQAYKLRVGLRTTRAETTTPGRASVCGLRSLTVSLEKYLVGPNTAVINNCRGSCAFPLVNTINHAVLLNSHIEGGNSDERAPCCVPVAYEALEVVDLNEDGAFLSVKPDVIAKECGCR